MSWGIHWFRRDLRLPGNAALRENWKRCRSRTLGVFCFDSAFLARKDFSHNRFAFFLQTLRSLQHDLQARGGDLLVVDEQPLDFFRRLLGELRARGSEAPRCVSWNRDYEPFARQRDEAISSFLRLQGVEPLTERDHLLFEPHEITKADSFYQIYTPFSRRWFEQLAGSVGRERVESQDTVRRQFDSHSKPEKSFELSWAEAAPPGFLRPDQLDSFIAKNAPHVTVPVPEAGFRAAYGRARAFAGKLTRYKDDRDLPGLPGTSRLSIYLKNGSLTVPQLLNELRLEKQGQKDGSGEAQFVRELAWREFYYHILFHRPDVEREPFHARYANLAWENDPALFARWQEGTTGFPIVDAGMRELRETGWMHNRVRMIVASFLTKDLLIDWRWGENHFMRELLDGDLAPNNGGWQWAASTGCDPQPYFRIFNPWLQGEKFDPEGNYIRRFVPELRDVPAKALHAPEASRGKYPTPVVNHALQKAKALQLYKRA